MIQQVHHEQRKLSSAAELESNPVMKGTEKVEVPNPWAWSLAARSAIRLPTCLHLVAKLEGEDLSS